MTVQLSKRTDVLVAVAIGGAHARNGVAALAYAPGPRRRHVQEYAGWLPQARAKGLLPR